MKLPTMNSVFNLAIRIIIIILTFFIIAVLVVGLFHTVWGSRNFYLQSLLANRSTSSLSIFLTFSGDHRIVQEFCRLFLRRTGFA